MTTFTVLLFATLKDRAGAPRVSITLPDGATSADLRATLRTHYPALAPALATAVLAINREFALEDVVLQATDELALFPPVSGGTDWPEHFLITEDALDLDALVQSISTPATGGVCLFTGLVRGTTTPERATGERLSTTTHLHYEAYQTMAEEKLRQVAHEIRIRWPAVQGIAIVQRIGRLAVGTPTVLIAVSAGHRDQGIFEAARYGIDRLKEIVPVWKQEIGPEQQRWIEGHYQPTAADTAPTVP